MRESLSNAKMLGSPEELQWRADLVPREEARVVLPAIVDLKYFLDFGIGAAG